MKIYTSYFANIRNLPKGVVPIAICLKSPDWYNGLEYKKLAPKYGFFMAWKKNHNNAYYSVHFQHEVLDTLDVNEVVKDLAKLSSGKDVALICFEKITDFCHRHQVSDWFRHNGIDCKEYIKEQ